MTPRYDSGYLCPSVMKNPLRLWDSLDPLFDTFDCVRMKGERVSLQQEDFLTSNVTHRCHAARLGQRCPGIETSRR